MDEIRTCQHCGKPIGPRAVGGLCPECLLKVGLGSGAQPPTNEPVTKPSAPLPEEIAPHFPQLEILELLGQGGMGFVYKARQPKLNRFVALKILARDAEKGPNFPERFRREAEALARLSHPNIVTIHDFGEAGGFYYLIMEFVDGVNLRELLRARKIKPEEALAIVPPICDALQFAHNQGIVHRDIKPENILLDKQGRVKIADFGIAKMLGRDKAAQPLTGEQQSIGTPQYMSPEQIEKPTTVDHRADIYSLGVVFYEMLTGELPIGRFALPSQKVQVDVRLDEIVLRALEKEPERRYQQATQMKTQVETVATSPASPGGRLRDDVPTTPASPNVWARRIFWLVATGLAVPVGLFAMALLAPSLARKGISAGASRALIIVISGTGLGLILTIWATLRAFRKAPVDQANPWPRRLVGILIAAILFPILLVLGALLLPELARSRRAESARAEAVAAQAYAEAARFNTALPYPQVTLIYGWTGDRLQYPDLMAFLRHLRRTSAYQQWLRVRDDHVFSETNSAGYRLEAHFVGLGSNPEAGGLVELITGVDLFQPDGRRKASMPLGSSAAERWDTKIYDETGTNVSARLQWRHDPQSNEKYYIEQIYHDPGTPHERRWAANRFGVIYSDSAKPDDVLWHLENSPYPK